MKPDSALLVGQSTASLYSHPAQPAQKCSAAKFPARLATARLLSYLLVCSVALRRKQGSPKKGDERFLGVLGLGRAPPPQAGAGGANRP